VRFDVLLGSLTGMLAGVLVMTMCQVRMVGGLLVQTGLVVLCSLVVMTGCVGMVLCCMLVMLSCFLRHVVTSFPLNCVFLTATQDESLSRETTLGFTGQ
jgi:hypothetical protein